MRTKQVIAIRKDLKMRRGKEIAQGSHASMAFLTEGAQKGFFSYVFNLIKLWFHKPTREWMQGSFAKICVQVNSEEELNRIYKLALEKKVKAKLIIDSGRTEFNGVPTSTAVAIGPDDCNKVDQVTYGLDLY